MAIRVSKYNHEGYNDPTAYEALNNVLREEELKTRKISAPASKKPEPPKSLVYICSPCEDDSQKSADALLKYRKFALAQNSIPVVTRQLIDPLLVDNPQDLSALCADTGIQLMNKCDEVWVFGKNTTRIMANEILKAIYQKKTIRYFTTSCKEILGRA